MADVEFEFNKPGIAEVCKSSGMQAALLEQAQRIASAANADASSEGLHIEEFKVPPYSAHADILTHTAVGAAHTNGKMGQLNEAKRFSLAKQCH